MDRDAESSFLLCTTIEKCGAEVNRTGITGDAGYSAMTEPEIV
jgi:hypothetical protein